MMLIAILMPTIAKLAVALGLFSVILMAGFMFSDLAGSILSWLRGVKG